ncbi:lysosome-associated membrane glycoprotein 1 isoform X1 [Symphalangus syndactylus]|uniref:lysosome-associated membrane glycoprotein 1 isoform X1 n=1 Tax=Symphalangus syndactylus TaxID=9590 RepID=UPI0024413790|nr:lysosome-associated membrane glycoprotein 1 [Symphalangus syndactylus]XP_055101084.1 lysosome-associated membrane glycoprotein 1 [Symphalangus syndactylus]
MAAPGSARRPLLLLLLLLLLGLVHCASAAMFMVKNGNGTACIMANFSAAFSVNYDTKSGPKNMTFDLPSDATVVLNSSSCGKENTSNPSLVIAFGRGHTLTLNFTRNATGYSVQLMSFVYNLSDTHLFPNASSKEIKTVESITDIRADIDKKYRCVSGTQVHMNNVTITLHDATIQAYLSNSSFSRGETRCEQDRPSPTTAPPVPPSPSPSPVPESPSVDKYNVSGTNGTCLLASMGLQLNLTYERKDNTMVTRLLNINPNKTSASGSCGAHLVTLELHSEGTTVLLFQFGMNASSSQFFLQGIQLNTILPDARDPAFKAANGSLRVLQATVGNSYKCNAEEHVRVTKAFSVNIFKVWVQAFKVEGGQFGSVEECVLDENNMLIPIAVGGALAGLVLIVLIAYLVGRKRSHAGYQTI